MRDFKRLAHAIRPCKYHIVRHPKYGLKKDLFLIHTVTLRNARSPGSDCMSKTIVSTLPGDFKDEDLGGGWEGVFPHAEFV